MKKNKINKTLLFFTAFGCVAATCLHVDTKAVNANDSFISNTSLYSQVMPYTTIIETRDASTSNRYFNTFDNYKTLLHNENYYQEYLEWGALQTSFYYISEASSTTTTTLSYVHYSLDIEIEVMSLNLVFSPSVIDLTHYIDGESYLFELYFDDVIDMPYHYDFFLEYSYLDKNNSNIPFGIVRTGSNTTVNGFYVSYDDFATSSYNLIKVLNGYLTITFDTPYVNINDSAFFEFYSFYTNSPLTYDDYNSYVDNYGGISNLGHFLTNSVGGFLDFEIAPGLSFSTILAVFLGISLLIVILKMFLGG